MINYTCSNELFHFVLNLLNQLHEVHDVGDAKIIKQRKNEEEKEIQSFVNLLLTRCDAAVNLAAAVLTRTRNQCYWKNFLYPNRRDFSFLVISFYLKFIGLHNYT